MLGLFNKKKKEGPFRPALSGNLETTYADLRAKFGANLAGRIYDINLGEQLAELPDGARLPKKIPQLVRNVLDDYLKAGEEFYFQSDEKTYGLFFSKCTRTVADLKIQVIRNELARVIEEAKRKIEQPAAEAARQPSDVNIRGRGTLSRAPDETEMREWANRAMANMTTRHGYADLYADVYRLAEIVKVQYAPMWYVTNKIVSGYVARPTAQLTRKTYDDRQAHEDLAILGAAIRQLREMRERGECALIIVPAWVQTLCQKSTRDLYNIYCRGLDTELKKFVVLQLKGLDALTPSHTDLEYLKGLAWHCRTMIVDTGLKKINPKKTGFMKFHSYGFDLTSVAAPEDQLFRLLDDYVAFYESHKKETFILGTETHSLLAASLGAGFSYISGPAVSPPLLKPKHASFFKFSDVYGCMLPVGSP